MSKKGVTRDAWIILKQAWNIAQSSSDSYSPECGNTTFGYYSEILSRMFGMEKWDEDIALYCLTAYANADQKVGSTQKNPFEETSPQEVLIPTIYRYEVEYKADDYESETYYDECNGEYSRDYELDCECEYATREIYNEKDDEWIEEECDIDYDDDCECETWNNAEVELYYWNEYKAIFYSLQSGLVDDTCTIDCLRDDFDTIMFEEEEVDWSSGYDDRTTWDYFSDMENGYINHWQEEEQGWEVDQILKL